MYVVKATPVMYDHQLTFAFLRLVCEYPLANPFFMGEWVRYFCMESDGVFDGVTTAETFAGSLVPWAIVNRLPITTVVGFEQTMKAVLKSIDAKRVTDTLKSDIERLENRDVTSPVTFSYSGELVDSGDPLTRVNVRAILQNWVFTLRLEYVLSPGTNGLLYDKVISPLYEFSIVQNPAIDSWFEGDE